MLLDKSLINMDSKRIRLDTNQRPLRPLQMQNSSQQPVTQQSSRSLQLPVYHNSSVMNGNSINNSNMQQQSIPSRTYFLSTNPPVVRIRNSAIETLRDQRGLSALQNPNPLGMNQSGGIPNNTMTGAVVPPNAHLVNPLRQNPQQQQSQTTLPTYNLQPPPPIFSGNVMRFPINLPNFTGVSGGMGGGGPAHSITIPSVEVRVGSRKFKTTSGVCFKDDGVLFTLKDYSYAPVLLNTRAILKCKANLNIVGYPVIFLLLETSCMKQIRNIFALTEDEFSHTSPVELLRYITIFPTYGPEHKEQSQHIMQSIKKSFDLMLKRFPRSSPVLEEISNEQCIDILYSPFINNNEQSTGAATVRLNNNVEEATQPATTVTPLSPPISQPPPSSIASMNIPTNHPIRNEPTAPQSHQRTRPQSSSTNHVENPMSMAVPLSIPSDQETWRQVQKDLTVGGVYHVMTPDGRKSYCLWNGTQLMPCLVHNTEVQMECSHARFGMSLLKCVGQVRVKADQTNGLYFTVRNTKKELSEVYIQPMDIIRIQICFHSLQSTILLYLTPDCSNRLSERTQIVGENSSLVRRPYDSASGDPCRTYLLLFIQNLHKDQEDALLQMKFNMSTLHVKKNSPMFEKVEPQAAISSLCEIVAGSSEAGKRFETSNNISGLQGYERLMRILLHKETIMLPSSVAPIPPSPIDMTTSIVDDDDDDDDIIMTQQELGIKCPYTQQVMRDPVMNKKCKHNYEKEAIFEFISLKKGNARCPYAGCANLDPLSAVDLESNHSLKGYIEMKQKS